MCTFDFCVSSFTFHFRLLNSPCILYASIGSISFRRTSHFWTFDLNGMEGIAKHIYRLVFCFNSRISVSQTHTHNSPRLLNIPKLFVFNRISLLYRSAGSKCVCAQLETLCSFIFVGGVCINKASSVFFFPCFALLFRHFLSVASFLLVCVRSVGRCVYSKSKDKITHLFFA